MEIGTRTRRFISLSVATTLMLAPVMYLRADDRTQVAAAIGAEEPKPAAPAQTAPVQPPTSPTSPTPAAPSPASTTTADTSSDAGFSKAQIWLGVGVAAFLAAVAGGGGSSTSH